MRRLACVLGAVLTLCSVAMATNGDRVKIGYLGRTLEEVQIFIQPNLRSQVVYNAQPFTNIVIREHLDHGWTSIVLQNRGLGYVRSEKVISLPYEVTENRQTGAVATDRQAVLQMSFNYIGTPYRWGGNSLTQGVDCSGFVQQLFRRIGVELPRTAAEQSRVGEPVKSLSDLRPGDRLYFWEDRRRTIGHTGIFLGAEADGKLWFIHSTSGRGVTVDNLLEPRWLNILVGARR